ncbi:MAG: replicative DNA helicase [Parcubacteria group bacterium]|nr:replicative DNA helicase [Parcubacteria group bacterium]
MTNPLDKLPPQNIDAEKSLLGSILIDPDSIHRVIDTLTPDDFYNRSHQLIFEAIVQLYQKREPIDVVTLTNKLEELSFLKDAGGVTYVTNLLSLVPTSAHIVQYSKIVQRKRILRELINVSHQIIELGFQEEEEIENILDLAEQKLFSVSQKSLSQEFVHIKHTLDDAFERLDRLHKGDGALRGISTGFYDLDSLTAGFQKSDLVVLAARPSLGKTSMAMDIARNASKKENVPVGIFSLEMSKEQVIDRLISSEAGISLWKLRTGKLSMDGETSDFSRISVALGSLAQTPIFIDDSPSPTVLQMRAMARRLQAEHGLGMIIVDYLQLIRSQRNYDSEVQQITEISRNLKALARELNIPVLAISQLSRATEARPDQRPKLSDLRSSGSIEQDADLVIFIYREDKVRRDTDKQNIAEIIIAKHRNGPTGFLELYFDEEQASFKNLAKNV